MSFWNKPVTQLKGVGPSIAEKLARLKLFTVQDLLFHFPLRFEDRSHVSSLRDVNIGDKALIVANIVSCQVLFKPRRQLIVNASENHQLLSFRLFHFSKAQQAQFVAGAKVQLYGEIRAGKHGVEMIHPEYKVLKKDQAVETQDNFIAVYPVTEGLQQRSLTKLIVQALQYLKQQSLEELYPIDTDVGLAEAIQVMHQPPIDTPLSLFESRQHPAMRALIAEELLAYQVSMLKLKQIERQQVSRGFPLQHDLKRQMLAALPFELTRAQLRVTAEIENDVKQAIPMNRLVQGDVGSGKTLVAAIAGLPIIESGCQVALMAPTEILAEQHFENFKALYTPLGIHVQLVVGKQTAKQKAQLYEGIAQGEIQMVIGTHAIFQSAVEFHQLGMIIIDEQHRFGVEQRKALLEKGKDFVPHQLVMTATPIPRTLAMTFYADLDVSIIDELPPGRKPVQTIAVPNEKRDKVIQRVAAACEQGRQAYWVCTLIEESEALQCQAAEATSEMLQQELPHLKVGLVHGKMKAKDKELEMQSFKNADIDLLVATTVIEVGVDVPNASLMIIENPERLGLSQLHQLRGRVGRGAIESHCVLMYQSPLSQNGQSRISIMRSSNDGFVIADEDLKLRGPGEVLGTKQTGDMNFKIANLQYDQAWVSPMHDLAQQILCHQPVIADKLIRRWLGNKPDFANV